MKRYTYMGINRVLVIAFSISVVAVLSMGAYLLFLPTTATQEEGEESLQAEVNLTPTSTPPPTPKIPPTATPPPKPTAVPTPTPTLAENLLYTLNRNPENVYSKEEQSVYKTLTTQKSPSIDSKAVSSISKDTTLLDAADCLPVPLAARVEKGTTLEIVNRGMKDVVLEIGTEKVTVVRNKLAKLTTSGMDAGTVVYTCTPPYSKTSTSRGILTIVEK